MADVLGVGDEWVGNKRTRIRGDVFVRGFRLEPNRGLENLNKNSKFYGFPPSQNQQSDYGKVFARVIKNL